MTNTHYSSSLVSEDFNVYLSERGKIIESYLDGCLPAEQTLPPKLSRAIRYSLFAGGKRLRPIVVLASAEAVGGSLADALPAAAAFEMIHTYSLIHDDLPAMDNDSIRRGKPTLHIAFDEALAVLAGDALQSLAFQILSEESSSVSPDRRLVCLTLLSKASGATGMVGGQVEDLEAEGKVVTGTTLESIHRHKTGALLQAAASAGAVIGGGNKKQVAQLTRYGANIGLAFQIIDDILDVTGTTKSLGKSAGKDAKTGKATYPKIYGIPKSKKRAQALVASALLELEEFNEAAAPLSKLAERVLNRTT